MQHITTVFNDLRLTDIYFCIIIFSIFWCFVLLVDADTNKHAHLYGIASLMIIPLGLLTVAAYFKRGMYKLFRLMFLYYCDGLTT